MKSLLVLSHEGFFFGLQVGEHFGINLIEELRMGGVPDERRVELCFCEMMPDTEFSNQTTFIP